MKKILAQSLMTAFLAVGTFTIVAPQASAATIIDFGTGIGTDPYVEDGFSFDPSRLVNGNCSPAAPCLALNDNETTVMTFAAGLFDLLSLGFNLIGQGTPNILTVFETADPTNTISFSVADFANNVYHTANFGTQFLNVLSITFLTPEGGNVRIDNVLADCDVGCDNQSTPEIPLPAAFPLLIGGLGGLAWLSRSRKRKALA